MTKKTYMKPDGSKIQLTDKEWGEYPFNVKLMLIKEPKKIKKSTKKEVKEDGRNMVRKEHFHKD